MQNYQVLFALQNYGDNYSWVKMSKIRKKEESTTYVVFFV